MLITLGTEATMKGYRVRNTLATKLVNELVEAADEKAATAGTHQLVDGDVLAALPTGAALVNVGRATTVDDKALHEALGTRALRGALLDVHDIGPLPADDPRWRTPGLVISPHRAFAFPGEPAAVGQAFQDNLTDRRAGRTARDAVVGTQPG